MRKRRVSRTSDNYYRNRTYFPPSTPLPVENGIKAKSKRGSFATSWWGNKFIELLESFGWENRLQRGRTYARKGQVVSIKISPGTIKAKVQGTMPSPYRNQITIPTFQESVWDKISKELAKKAVYAAQLLTGEMPHDIDTELEKLGYNLLPKRSTELETECSCPDFANPCKHVAAVYYLVAERFDENPFIMFEIRGILKEKFLAKLKTNRIDSIENTSIPQPQKKPTTKSQKKPIITSKDISVAEIQSFWGTTRQSVLNNAITPQKDKLNLLDVILAEQTQENHSEIKKVLLKLKKHFEFLYTKI